MKKVLSLILALCLFAALLPMTVLADTTEPTTAATEAVEIPEAPESVKVKIYNGIAKDFTLTIKAGNVVYLAADENKELIKWAGEEAPADNFLKLEYVIDETGIMKATFMNLVVDQTEAGGYTCHGIWFQGGEYAIEMELIGENSMTHGKSACIKTENAGGITITGAGSMSMTIGTPEVVGSASGALWTNGGNLVIKDTTMNFTINASATARHHAILSGKGNVTMENSKITSSTLGGQLVYTGLATDKNVRYTMDPDTNRFITIKNCEITAKAGSHVFESINPVTVEGCTMNLRLSNSSGAIFSPAPEFVGDYTAMAGLAKNADKPEKLKEYSAKKNGSYTFMSIVPYVVETPTEPTTEATEPVIVPEITEPVVTQPVATEPVATEPAATEPQETTPATTEATEPADDTTSGNPLVTVLIIMIALVVVAGAGVGVLVVLKKKKG